jgi:hypothetical protein|tara:strand:+ start:1364 stop:1561 length:198 start_codon:yes stop_codon:yes gene_type:complete
MSKEANANIRFNISEINWLIIALQLGISSSRLFNNINYRNAFEKLLKDLTKIRGDLIEEKNTVSS